MGRSALHVELAGSGGAVSLLEALVALVILGVSAVGYLDVFQSGVASAIRSNEWTRLVAEAEAVVEAASLGDALQAQQALAEPDSGWERQLQVRPFAADLSELVVTVTSPRGTTFTVHRLLRVPSLQRVGR